YVVRDIRQLEYKNLTRVTRSVSEASVPQLLPRGHTANKAGRSESTNALPSLVRSSRDTELDGGALNPSATKGRKERRRLSHGSRSRKGSAAETERSMLDLLATHMARQRGSSAAARSQVNSMPAADAGNAPVYRALARVIE